MSRTGLLTALLTCLCVAVGARSHTPSRAHGLCGIPRTPGIQSFAQTTGHFLTLDPGQQHSLDTQDPTGVGSDPDRKTAYVRFPSLRGVGAGRFLGHAHGTSRAYVLATPQEGLAAYDAEGLAPDEAA
jgi:hypothetical protein